MASKAKPVIVTNGSTVPTSEHKPFVEESADEITMGSPNDSVPGGLNAKDASMDVVDDENVDGSPQKSTRGAKRQATSDDDVANTGSIGKKAGKRARRQSRKLQEVLTEDEDVSSMDVDSISRGKKRDRTEAESSFGVDDSMTAGRSKKNRLQKRKSSGPTEMENLVQSRGTKRSYEVESTLDSDDGSGSFSRPSTSRKRGKISGRDSSSDISMDDVVPDPACAGRKIGEEWQSNGETFKVGPDGRRLRQVLLRKRRSRFSMVSLWTAVSLIFTLLTVTIATGLSASRLASSSGDFDRDMVE